MKTTKTPLILTLGLLLWSQANASEGQICTQVVQPAVNPQGECVLFPTPCDVPDSHKKVSSCDLVENKDRGQSLRDRLNNRFTRFSVNRKQPTRTKSSNLRYHQGRYGYGRPASASINRTINNGSTRTNYTQRRTSVEKSYNQKSINYARQVNQRTDLNRRETLSNKYNETNTKRWYGAGSGTQMDRTGALSNKPKWNVESQRHTKQVRNYGRSKVWQSHRQISEANRPKKKTYQYEGPKLRKIYKGERLDGNLDQ